MHERIIIISTIVYTTDSLKALILDGKPSPEKIGAMKGLFAVLNAMYETINHGQKWTASPKELVEWMLVYTKDLADTLDPSNRPVIRVN